MIILIKFIDDFISSVKNLQILELNYKKVFFYTALKTALFLMVVSQASSSTPFILAMVALSSGLGSAIPVLVASKKKDKLEDTWRYNIKCHTIDTCLVLKEIYEACGMECVARENAVSSKNSVTLEVIATSSEDSKKVMMYAPVGAKITIDKNIESFIKKA